MLGERTSLKNRGCWRVVRTPEGVKLIKSRYLYQKKDSMGKITKQKSRLVALGYQQKQRVEYDETLAPIPITLFLMLTLAQIYNLCIHH